MLSNIPRLKNEKMVKNGQKYATLSALIFAGPKFREFREGQFFGYFAGIKFREFREWRILISISRI